MPHPLNNCIGKFRLDHRQLRDESDFVQRVMAACIVVRAESLYWVDAIEYYAYSAHFDSQPDAAVPPEYYWLTDADGLVMARKVEQ